MENNTEKMVNTEQETPAEATSAVNTEEKKGSILSDLFEIAESTLIAVFVMMMIITYFLHPVNISGHSMVPTLNKEFDLDKVQDKILMSMVYTDVNYGDIIVIDNDANYLLDDNGEVYVPDQKMSRTLNQCIIKRVIAVSGQRLDINYDTNEVIVDGVVQYEPYIKGNTRQLSNSVSLEDYNNIIPEGYLFVMGDNREGSLDSRSKDIGLIPVSNVIGKAQIFIYPFDKFSKTVYYNMT